MYGHSPIKSFMFREEHSVFVDLLGSTLTLLRFLLEQPIVEVSRSISRVNLDLRFYDKLLLAERGSAGPSRRTVRHTIGIAKLRNEISRT